MKAKQKNKGVVLLIVVFVISLLAVTVIGILQINTEEIQLIDSQVHAAQTLAIAEAGLNDALYQLRRDRNWTGDAGGTRRDFANGSYTITATSGLAGSDITSIATLKPPLGAFRAEIRALVTIQNAVQPPYIIRIDNLMFNE
jgi:hypothetical protein